MGRYNDYLARQTVRHGDKFNPGGLDSRFVPYFEMGTRVKVRTCGMDLTGTIGVTTGWGPCFLLMRTARSAGSSWTLGPKDAILAVKRGKHYVSLS